MRRVRCDRMRTHFPDYAAMPIAGIPKTVNYNRPFFIATPGECWEWCGGTNPEGYGKYCYHGKLEYLHRIMMGIPAPGMDVDHLCRNPLCCNPDHLEIVTRKENIRRGVRFIPKTECQRGHPFNKENTHIDPEGNRRCLTCRQATKRRWYEKKKRQSMA